MAWLTRRAARRRCYSVRSWLLHALRPTHFGRCSYRGSIMLCFMRKPKGMETARLPCRIVVYGDLPIGVRLAFYSSRSVKIVRCVNVAFDYPGSGGGLSFRCRIGTADVSRAPESLPQTPRMVVAAAQPQMQPNFGGGFSEFLFSDSAQHSAQAAAMVWCAAAGTNLCQFVTDRSHAGAAEIGRAHGSSLPARGGCIRWK